jgi:hypothetical protein
MPADRKSQLPQATFLLRLYPSMCVVLRGKSHSRYDPDLWLHDICVKVQYVLSICDGLVVRCEISFMLLVCQQPFLFFVFVWWEVFRVGKLLRGRAEGRDQFSFSGRPSVHVMTLIGISIHIAPYDSY